MATRKQLEQQYIQDKAFWGSVSARWRGLAGGVVLGSLIGLTLGVLSTATFGIINGVELSQMIATPLASNAALGVLGVFAAAGALVGGGLWGAGGQVAGAVASGLMAQKEIEGRDPKLEQEVSINPTLEAAKPKQKLFNFKAMAIGAAVSAAVGGLLAASGVIPPTATYGLLGQTAGTTAGIAAAATTFGFFGTVFGIGFKPYQALKHVTDGFFEGRVTGRSTPSMEQIKANLLKVDVPTPEPDLNADISPAFAAKLTQERQDASKACCNHGLAS